MPFEAYNRWIHHQCDAVGDFAQIRIKERCCNIEEDGFTDDDAGITCVFAVRYGVDLSKSRFLPFYFLSDSIRER